MHSDVANRAAAHAVGEACPTGGGARTEVTERRRAPLTSLSLQSERDVLRAAAIDDDATTGFQSHI